MTCPLDCATAAGNSKTKVVSFYMNHWQCTLEGNVTMPEIGLQSFSKNSFRKLLRWHPKKEDPNVMKRQDAKRKEEKREQNCFKMRPKYYWIRIYLINEHLDYCFSRFCTPSSLQIYCLQKHNFSLCFISHVLSMHF